MLVEAEALTLDLQDLLLVDLDRRLEDLFQEEDLQEEDLREEDLREEEEGNKL